MTTTFIREKAQQLEGKTIAIRRYLHEHPELSSEEVETVKFLKKELAAFDLLIEDVPNSTGFTALLDTKKPGKTLGIRTDIDALPVKENVNNLRGAREVISKNPGVMHACGHDGHMAIMLTTIDILTEMKDELTGKIYFIFEEGEEIGSGIDAMIAHLKDKQIDAIYGNHLASFLESGKVSIDAGPKMAGAALVEMTVHGKGGHGSRPDLSVNPIFAAANILTGLTNAWANRVDVTKTVTLGITQIHAGQVNNVIPDEAMIGGSLRFYDIEEGEKAIQYVKDVATYTARAHGCTVTFSDMMKVVANPVINDEGLAEIAINSTVEILPEANVEGIQWFASEPFNKYRTLCPILFGFIGIKNEAAGSGAEHHNEYFDVDEAALMNGVLVMTKFAVDFLQRK